MSYRRLAEALLLGRPYFGPALRALQGPPLRHQYMAPVVKAVGHQAGHPIEILEIGSWAGASAISWASALQTLGLKGRVTCVDPWRPYFDLGKEHSLHYQRMNRAAGSGMIHRLFRHNVSAAGFAGVIREQVGESREILPKLPARRFHIVYIDGSHAFQEVQFDIQQAKRLVRRGGVVCGDDLELQAKDLAREELEAAADDGQDFVFSPAVRAHYHPGVTAAVGREFGEVSVRDGFWAVRFVGPKRETAAVEFEGAELPPHVASAAITIEADTTTHHLISMDGVYFAMAKELGPPEIAAELLPDVDLPPAVFTGRTLEEVRSKVEQSGPVALDPSPLLVGSYRGFNLVLYNGRAYGLRASLGPVDLHLGDAALEAQYYRSDMLLGESIDGLRARIDNIEPSRQTEAGIAAVKVADTETASRLQEVVDRAQAGLHDVTVGLRQTEAEIAAVKVADTETASRLQEVVDRTQAGLHDVAAAVEELRAQAADKMVLQPAAQGALEALSAEATGKMQTVQAQVERFRVEAQNAVDEIRRVVDQSHGQAAAEAQAFRESFERASAELQEAIGKMQTLAAQIAQSQAPPAAGSAPQLVEFYAGFKLVRYGSRTYGLRNALGDVDLLLGDILLEARYGGEDLVIGDSTDGVKARIDALEAERAVQKLSERLQALESSIVKS